jgi:hypothetical protein
VLKKPLIIGGSSKSSGTIYDMLASILARVSVQVHRREPNCVHGAGIEQRIAEAAQLALLTEGVS